MLSILLCLVMVMSLLPTAVFAVDEQPAGSEIYVDANNTSDGDGTKDNPYKDVATAVNNAKSGDTIQLAAGTYTLYNKNANVENKNLTFVGAGTQETTWNIGTPENDAGGQNNGDFGFKGAKTLVFQNMTLKSGVTPSGKVDGGRNYMGFTHTDKTIVEKCVIEGKTFYWGYTSAMFKDTTFNCPSGDYALWTYCSPEMTFDGCTFNASGKIINVYTDYSADKDIVVNFKDCTVNNSAFKKQVLKINDSNKTNGSTYTINISGKNVINNTSGDPAKDVVEPNEITCSRLFGFDNETENAGHTQVSINGTTVWENGKRVGDHNNTTLVADDKNSYTNGVDGSNANVLYTDGYKDDAFTTSYGSWEWDQNKNQLARTVTKTCDYCGETVETTEYKDLELDVSRSKTATALDSSDQSTVTLSLPSAEENLATDVVLALDVSKCTKDTLPAVQSLLNDLSAVQKESGANIKIGIAMFKGSAVPFQELVTLTPDKNTELQTLFNQFLSATGSEDAVEDAVRDYLKTKFTTDEYLNTGTNMPAGLLLAKKMLDEDTAVKANRKYMILVSDGSTYLFTHDNDYSTAWSRQHEPGSYQGGLYELNLRHSDFLMGKDATVADWTRWLESVGEFSKTFTDEYDYEWKGVNTTCPKQIPNSKDVKYLINGDTSVYQSAMFYKQMQEDGYNCYYCYTYDSEDNYGRNALRSLNDDAHLIDGANTQNVFSSIEKDIIFAVGADSVVEDKMGEDFDFVPGTLKLTVGGTELVRKVDADNENVVYFGDDAENLNESNCRFKVEYNSSEDKFTWTINENVSNFAPVQLSYKVELDNRSTAAGTYTVPTNEYAKLTPKNSAGYTGKVLDFNIPTISYTVKGSGGGGGSTTYYYFALEKIDAQDSHTLNGAKFGLYLDGKQIATATSNSSGIATFRVDASSYRKIDATSSLYYQELIAPEGYIVSSDKIDIEKSDLTTSQTAAEKKAETVRNYRSSTPDLLNGDDHFAYVIGYEDGSVRPNGQISRAETATIFFRLLKDSVRDGNLLTSNTYTDVADNYWANTAISTMTGLGIVQGRSSTTFDPQAPITRAEFAAICARFDTGTSSGSQTFSDISGHWAEKYIQRAAELGWIKGFTDGTFRPNAYITRAEAMTMINRVLNRIPEENSDLLANMNVWPDCTTNDWFYLAVQEATNSHDFKHKAGNYETWTGMKADPDWTRYEN